MAKFWYNGFLIVWNAGLRDAFFAAKNKNPTYELWVTGFSMGGSMAGNAAAYISQMGYLKPAQIKLVTFGETRIGHPDFANRYPSLVPYAYRVTHNRDIVPHIIPTWGGYQHHQNEVITKYKTCENLFRFGTLIICLKETSMLNVMNQKAKIAAIVFLKLNGQLRIIGILTILDIVKRVQGNKKFGSF